jgi:hypothetical protein
MGYLSERALGHFFELLFAIITLKLKINWNNILLINELNEN